MATRNFVPRAGSEGQIGTTTKPWDKVIAVTSSFAVHSGSITGDDLTLISGSVLSTGSFGRLEVAGDTSIGGDLALTGNITIGDADTDSLTINADLTSNLIPDIDSTFDIGTSTKNWKVGHIEQISSTNITASSDISSSGDIFSTNITATATIQAEQITSTDDITAAGTVQAEQITSTDDINASGKITSNERIDIQKANAHLSLGPNASAQSFHGGILYHDSSISGTSLGNVSGFAATTSGAASNFFLLQLAGGNGMYMQVGNDGIINFPSATTISGSSASTGSFGRIKAAGDIQSDGRIFEQDTSVIDHATAMAIVFGG